VTSRWRDLFAHVEKWTNLDNCQGTIDGHVMQLVRVMQLSNCDMFGTSLYLSKNSSSSLKHILKDPSSQINKMSSLYFIIKQSYVVEAHCTAVLLSTPTDTAE
jgi:hypothetical protein